MKTSLVVAALLTFSFGLAPGQERSQPPAADKPKAAADKSIEPNGREEHVIYVPYTKIKDVFEREDASVLLPYAQFLQMWGQMIGPIVPPMKPPVAGVITRADYSGTVEGDLVRLRATLAVEVLDKEWARLPIQFGDAAVGEAKSDDDAALLRGVGNGSYELLVTGRGKHSVAIELVARVKAAPDGKSFAINCPPVGVSNLDLLIPEKDLAVQVTPRRTSQLAPADGGTRVRATLGSTDQFAVSWQPKSGAAAEMAGVASVSDTIDVAVGDGVVHTHAVFDYTILRGTLDSLTVLVPAADRVLDVQVQGLRDWQSEAADEQQRITVRLHAATKDKLRLEVRTESPIPDKEFRVGQVRATGVARESGIIAVRSAEDVGLDVVTHEAVTRIDAAEVPEPMRKPRSTFYKFFSPDFRLAVAASPLEPRVAVDSFLTVSADKARQTLRGEFRYSVTRAGIFQVRLRLPAGFNVDDVQCEAMERHETAAEDDAQVLSVFLTKKILGDLKVVVVASQPRGLEPGDLELPLIEPLGASREQGLVAVIAPESLEVNSDPTKLEAARAATPAELVARGFTPQPPAGSRVAGAFAFARRPVKIGLSVAARPRRIEASVATVVTTKESEVAVETSIRYVIKYAGTDTFRIVVPLAAAESQIDGPDIKERPKFEKIEGDDEFVARRIILYSDAIGEHTFTLKYTQKIIVPDRGAVPVKIQPVRVLDADSDTGEIAVLKDRSLALEPKHEGLEEIDPRELARPTTTEQPYLAFRYWYHPAKLRLDVTKHELQDVVRTVVNRALVEAVVNRDGPMTMRARYLVKSSEKQRLAITLPATRVLGMTVAGKSVTPEKAPPAAGAGADDKSYYINVSRQTDPDVAFPIAIVFEAPEPPGKSLNTTDQLSILLPRFDRGVKFQQLYVRVWMPEKYRAVGEPPGFTTQTRLYFDRALRQVNIAAEDPDSLFAGDVGTFDFRTAGNPYLYSSLSDPSELVIRYWHSPSMTAVGSLLVAAIGVVLVFFKLEFKVILLLATIFATLLAGIFWPEAVKSWVAAAQLGLAATFALWLIVFLIRMRHALPSRSEPPAPSTVAAGPPASDPAAQPPPNAESVKPADAGAEGGSHGN
jgi:hypothetical protein